MIPNHQFHMLLLLFFKKNPEQPRSKWMHKSCCLAAKWLTSILPWPHCEELKHSLFMQEWAVLLRNQRNWS